MSRQVGRGALEGTRVLELGQLVAGPFCGQLLGDMGAEVVKLEPPQRGDPLRTWGSGETKLWWEVLARNKKSVSADLRQPEGQEIARRLAERADIFIENFRPGTIEKWGLSPEHLLEINPRLIIVRISGYGQSGPYASRPGFGSVGEAMGGLRHIVGEVDRPPARVGISIGDALSGSYGAMAALAALEARHRTGRGQVIDMALYEGVLQVMEALVPEFAVSGITRGRSGSVLPGIAPSNAYPCKDGTYLIAANQDGIFRRLCLAMGRSHLADDPAYSTHVARGRNQAELDEVIAGWTSTRTLAEVEQCMTAHAVPAGRVYTAREMFGDPQFAARESIVTIDHPRFGKLAMQNSFPVFSETSSPRPRAAPQAVGEDNEEILADVGLSADAIADLYARKII